MTWPGNLIDNRPIQNVDNKLRLKKMQGKKLAKEFGIKIVTKDVTHYLREILAKQCLQIFKFLTITCLSINCENKKIVTLFVFDR